MSSINGMNNVFTDQNGNTWAMVQSGTPQRYFQPQQMQITQPQVPIQQQPQPQTQKPNILSAFVNDINDVKPNMIPMDGTPFLILPQSKDSVYLKYWDENGMIQTQKFVKESLQTIKANDEVTEVYQKLEKRVAALEKKLTQKTKGGTSNGPSEDE